MRFPSCLMLITLCGIAAAADSITLTGEDDVKGGKRLGAWLAANDVDATTLESSQVKVKGKVLTVVILPRLSKDGIDRLLFTSYVTTTDEAKADDAALADMVMTLNAESNIGAFSLDSDKDLVLRSQVTFVDTLEFAEIEKFLDWYDTSAFVLLTQNKKAAALLK